MCTLKELKDGTYNLEDLYILNEMLFCQRYIEDESIKHQNKQEEKAGLLRDYRDKMRGVR